MAKRASQGDMATRHQYDFQRLPVSVFAFFCSFHDGVTPLVAMSVRALAGLLDAPVSTVPPGRLCRQGMLDAPGKTFHVVNTACQCCNINFYRYHIWLREMLVRFSRAGSPGHAIYLGGQGDIECAKTADIMGAKRYLYGLVDIEPFRVVIHVFGH